MTGPRSAGRPRDPVVDIARGIAILAIVAGHVARGLLAPRVLSSTDPVVVETDAGLYLWHLAVFAVTAGLVAAGAYARRGAAAYLRERVILLGYLYLVWTVLLGLAKVVAGGAANHRLGPVDVARTLWEPDAPTWFLGLLVVTTLILVVGRPWQSRTRALATLAPAVLVGLATWGVEGDHLFLMGPALVLPVVVGAALTHDRLAEWLATHRYAAAAALLPALAIAVLTDPTPPTIGADSRTVLSVVLGVLGSALAALGVLGAAQLLAGTGLGAGLAALGRRSLEVFLAHVAFTAATRAALLALGVQGALPHLGLGVLAGVAGPLLLWWLGSRVPGLGLLFRPPAAWLGPGPVAALGPRRREGAR